MSDALAQWNQLPAEQAARMVLDCCGSQAWAKKLAERRPFRNEQDLVGVSDEIWNQLSLADWMEAFSRHPRIGERKAPAAASARSAAWSAQEQGSVASAESSAQSELAEGNRQYEQRFGRVFIVCAIGKSAREMLEILRRRLRNDDATELREAAEEQRRITNLRLRKWLAS